MTAAYNPFALTGKTVLVTGASSGIGRATAIDCARMGATVIITGRNEERLAATLAELEGEGHQSVAADLCAEGAIDEIVKGLPELQGVVLCAGKGDTTPILFATRKKFDDIFAIDFFAPVELLRMLLKKKKLRGGSSAVIISSIGGVMMRNVANGVYEAAKAAINSTMMIFAKEMGSRHIRVNSVCPGMVETPLIHGGNITEEQLKADEALYPLGRYGQPEDVAHACVYLLSDAASWVTGHSLVVDGGRIL